MAGDHRRALVIGLDCATSQFLFDTPDALLPGFARLRRRGRWGLLESCIPPITCPAWMCMATSRDPGQLGIYGFRNRRDHSYDALSIPNSGSVTDPAVWDVASEAGLQSLVMAVPLTYPPKPLNGWMVSGFLAPGTEADYTNPIDVRDVIHDEVPHYSVDVRDFRTEDRDGLLERLYRATRGHFSAFEHLLAQRPWDFTWFVEMGVDRVHHAFWRFAAKDHPAHEPGNRYEDAVLRYYQYVDGCVSRVLALVPEDTIVLIASDHGARTLMGALAINDWLIAQGLLTLRARPTEPTRLRPEMVDWSRTRVWGEGGYYSRLFANVRGREPEGVVAPAELDGLLGDLSARLEAMVDHCGAPLGNRVFRPEGVYREVRGVAPDLLLYPGDLAWRAAGTVGNESRYLFENDTGPDDANHAQHGVFILIDPDDPTTGEMEGVTLYDIAPTLLERMGLPVPGGMIGRPIPRG